MYEIIIDGPINLSGMGNVTRGFIQCLNEIPEFKVKVYDNCISPQLAHKGIPNEELKLYDELSKNDMNTNALYIQIGSPRIFKKVPFRYNIGWTLFESDGYHPYYVQQCNNVLDEVWTGSRFNKQTFGIAGINKKIRIIPPMIDTEKFKPGIDKLNIKNLRKYVFQSNFDFSWRKGMDKLLHAFWDEFTDKDDVCLILKIFSGDEGIDQQRHLMNQINFTRKKLSLGDKPAAPILFLGSFLNQEYMPAFSNTCDCYITPFRGEGFGLCIAEAMSLEKQCIATRWSAPIEYLNKKNGYLINLDTQNPLVPITDDYQLKIEQFYQGQQMANPDIDHLKKLMHTVIEEKENGTYLDKIKLARQTIIDKYSKEQVKKILKDNILEIFENRVTDDTNKGLF